MQFNYDNAMTGHPSQVYEAIIRSIAAIARPDRDVRRMYIGISSGETGMERRVDEYKLKNNIQEMLAVYTTTSHANARHLEGLLVNHFGDHPVNINRTGGGGGRNTSQDVSQVYVAINRFDPPTEHYGPRGGQLHYTSSGTLVYNSSTGSNGVHKGPRGGRFEYTSSGKKHHL